MNDFYTYLRNSRLEVKGARLLISGAFRKCSLTITSKGFTMDVDFEGFRDFDFKVIGDSEKDVQEKIIRKLLEVGNILPNK